MPDPNLSGLWMGSYTYPSAEGPTTPFLARIEDHDGALSGSIMEPNTIGRTSDELEAVLTGTREGHAVDFTKVYDGASDAAHAVDYVGRLSGDGNSVTGVWSLEQLDGTFEMHREAVWEEQAEEEAEVVKLENAVPVDTETSARMTPTGKEGSEPTFHPVRKTISEC